MMINKPYPCRTEDSYICPVSVRSNRYDHVDSYHVIVASANDAYPFQMDESLAYFTEFLNKFYQGTNIDNEELEPLKTSQSEEINNYVPGMALKLAQYLVLNGSINRPKKFLNAALAVNCTYIGWMNFEQCLYDQQTSQMLLDTLNYIPHLP